MNRMDPPLSPETEALLAHERDIAPVPSSVRERAITRARASLRSRVMATPVIMRAPTRARWAIAAGMLGFASVAMGAAAYQIRVRWSKPAADSPAVSLPANAVAPVVRPAQAPAALPIELVAPPERVVSAPRATRPVVSADELRLLRQARAAVARQDFTGALPPLAEHTRRFKDGRMAEEREALRVKALAG
ncbi:MAG TPA: hypothetical protein VHU40_11750, partial [Polyangia bacterium]|nr:hypothetical protein [Polyangia bacterium]